jgi:hypothetical protein
MAETRRRAIVILVALGIATAAATANSSEEPA